MRMKSETYPAGELNVPSDWLMVGAPVGPPKGGVMIAASRDLSVTELRAEMTYYPAWDGWGPIPLATDTTVTEFHVNSTMKSVRMVWADNYGDALMMLLRSWDPDDPAPVQVEQRRTLPG